MRYIVNTALTADSNACNSLSGVLDFADQDVGYVQNINRYYRFFAASTVTPNGTSVVIPDGQDTDMPGRWIRQGPPGPALVDPSKPANLSTCISNLARVREYTITWAADDDLNTVTFNLLPVMLDLADGTYVVALIGTDASAETTYQSAVFGTIAIEGNELVTRPALTGTNSSGGSGDVTASTGFTSQSVTCAWAIAADVPAQVAKCIVFAMLPPPEEVVEA